MKLIRDIIKEGNDIRVRFYVNFDAGDAVYDGLKRKQIDVVSAMLAIDKKFRAEATVKSYGINVDYDEADGCYDCYLLIRNVTTQTKQVKATRFIRDTTYRLQKKLQQIMQEKVSAKENIQSVLDKLGMHTTIEV